MERLAPLVGEWTMEARIPQLGPEPLRGRAVFEYTLEGAFLLSRAQADHPDAPDSLTVMGRDGDGYLQHYYDARGIARLYRMRFDDGIWTLQRDEPDFSPLPFHQRFTGTVTADSIDGRWETSDDGASWKLDFDLLYTRSA
jgi:hypothetical protein